ncbi:sigma-G-dependent sporulation-specific acid-soluble spore protein CsgA [Anoxybacillus sp. LAT_35]|uniref:sigma-G-dependent sporulation-specific acid-soluble spore protein CsgA n=1 Tax=unclassified Anoxybacillus TaxID=2639704 RepID=UPI001ED9E1EE|nr:MULTISPECIES: sigma-G-dependent sporulation-specific acid-soluble spore protein CsgA [unclassified Anoxybacillus]MCG5025069.1 sigma-G-dependent sporulation-specific acid-soluble spore protein CsgA [Anoxybacillus flavithermus]MCG3083594.1 sigma-G-dependent sporulation-specific acid-soluble spore protein CsgA [Anoxybacillus sp. LAT27]MCG6170303.1 sigma-G-dependent sporulation-specific acid-soluble spore protein CsgA [Anoxybacillus sp. LAT_11]MCG6174834.1 sigma-G-dependent sporulation-specific 
MNQTLAYLREALASYADRHHAIAIHLYKKLISKPYKSEEQFVRDLSPKEVAFLDRMPRQEMKYAKEEQDNIRVYHLNEVYEQLI